MPKQQTTQNDKNAVELVQWLTRTDIKLFYITAKKPTKTKTS